MREVWRGTLGTIDEFADFLMGSSGVFGDRGPTASINFITSHDGFTLGDLVSYDVKHNEANGERNRDGEKNNRSWNSGTEGETDNPEINDFRNRRVANFLLTLFISQGVPMLLGGDEIGRTQRGNNNAYCQDNEMSWFDWQHADWQRVELVRKLAQIRRDHPVFRRTEHPRGEPDERGLPQAGWFTPAGQIMTEADWQTVWVRTLGVFWNGTRLQRRIVLSDHERQFRTHPLPSSRHARRVAMGRDRLHRTIPKWRPQSGAVAVFDGSLSDALIDDVAFGDRHHAARRHLEARPIPLLIDPDAVSGRDDHVLVDDGATKDGPGADGDIVKQDAILEDRSRLHPDIR